MEIKVRITSNYAEVAFIEGRTRIESGLLNNFERRDLALTLQVAAEDLLRGIELPKSETDGHE